MNLLDDPYKQFNDWYGEALKSKEAQADACALATASNDARPSVRMVLFKGIEGDGFQFFTNFNSRKGRELNDNRFAAVVWHWPTFPRQVRIEGRIEALTAEQSDAYWKTRPRGSQIGAWASNQSETISSYDELTARAAALEKQYQGKEIPRPKHWGGFAIIPDTIEFWVGLPSRLHFRQLYTRAGKAWAKTILCP